MLPASSYEQLKPVGEKVGTRDGSPLGAGVGGSEGRLLGPGVGGSEGLTVWVDGAGVGGSMQLPWPRRTSPKVSSAEASLQLDNTA